jgi:hypothetical protein
MTTITDTELLLYRSATITNTADNGGRLSASQVPAGQKHAVFPPITGALRAAGATVRRKLFWKVAHAGQVDFLDARAYLGAITPAGTRVVILAADQRGTQANLTGAERRYGVGALSSDVAATATTLTVTAEVGAAADLIFQVGDTLRIAGAVDEFAAISAVSWAGEVATLTLTAGLLYSHAAATPTVVSACRVASGPVVASVDNVAVTGAGVFNSALVALDGIGAVEQTWTLTFTSATAYTVLGDTLGPMGAGTIGADFGPLNPDFGRPYLTIPAAAWGGTIVAGNSVTFQTHPAALPFWAVLEVPAGCAAAPDSTVFGLYGESA